MRRAWLLFLVVMTAATAGYFALPSGLQLVLYGAMGIAAGAAVVASVLLGRTAPAAPWLLVGLGVLAFALGDIAYGESQPVPSIADMFYISAYPLLAIGLGGLGSSRRPSHLSAGLSAGLVTGMVVFVSYVFIILPGPNGYGTEVVMKVVALGYPVVDLVLLALLARAMAAEGELPGTYALFGTAIVLWLVADLAYAVQDFGTTYSGGQYIDAAWLAAYAVFGAAALHPSAWDVAPAGSERSVKRRLVGRGYVRDVRFRDVVRWSGIALLVLSAVAIACGAAWRAPDIAVLGGTFGTTGGVMCLVVGLNRARHVRSLPKLKGSDLRSVA